MTAITFVQTMPWLALGRRWRSKHNRWFFEYGPTPKGYQGKRRFKAYEGVTAKSVPLAELMPTEGVLREDLHEDLADLIVDADKNRAEVAERGNDTRDDVLGGIDPEIHAANDATFTRMFADFDVTFKAIVDRFINEPQAPRRVLAAADMTQEIDMRAVRLAITAEAALCS